MRTILPLTIVGLVFATHAHAGQAEYGSADWAQANLARLEGQRVTLKVSHCEPGRIVGDVQWLTLATPHKWPDGSQIEACIRTSDMQSFFTRVGSTATRTSKRERAYRTTAVAGILRRDASGHAYLDLGAGAQADEKKPTASEATPRTRIRTWTSTDGRKIEAEFLSANTVMVKIRRLSDDRVFELELAKLSEADRVWVAAQ